MMFLFAVPIMLGVGLYFVPLMIGTRDVAFPKMNALGYWIYALSGLVLWGSLFLGTAPDGGWFAYVPLTLTRYSPSYGMDIYSALITGTEISALIAATELIVTIFMFRAPGMSFNRIPLFVWAMLVTAFMVIFAMPSVVIATLELLLDRGINTNFFNPNLGGNPLLVIVVSAVGIYNDFTSPLYFLPGAQNVTVQLTLYSFISQFSSQWNLLFANVIIITIPPLIMFMFFQRQIVSGMTAGAIKG